MGLQIGRHKPYKYNGSVVIQDLDRPVYFNNYQPYTWIVYGDSKLRRCISSPVKTK